MSGRGTRAGFRCEMARTVEEGVEHMRGERILVAMSGGVDSSVAAALLVERGFDVVGAYMKNWINEDNVFGDCPWHQDIEDAQAVADRLGIEFRVVNLMRDYRERVVEYLLAGYQSGITPNPDVMCNREIKFGVFLDYALEEGFSAVATGHYARTASQSDGTVAIYEGADPNKDQSYFLALMTQNQVAHARFPIGGLHKPAVRAEAERLKLPTARKKDSQGICFIGQVKMSDFLAAYVPDKPGRIVTLDGHEVGEHRGLHYFTIGQRKRIGVASPEYKRAYVVVEKRIESNELVIGWDEPETEGLYSASARLASVSWTRHPLTAPRELLARPRYRAPAVTARYLPEGGTHGRIEFHEPQRALAIGQICALYAGNELLGGAVFESVGKGADTNLNLE